MGYLFNLLRLLFLFFLLLFLIYLFNLWFVTFLSLFVFLFLLFLRICDFLLFRFLYVELDRKSNEFRMLLHKILQTTLLQELGLVLFQITDNFSTTLHLSMHLLRILLHRKGATGRRFPNILLIVIVFAHNSHLVRNEICGVETHAELANHGDIATSSHSFHESLCARFSDGTQVVHELVFGHADTRILNGESRVGLIWNDLNVKIWLCFNFLR